MWKTKENMFEDEDFRILDAKPQVKMIKLQVRDPRFYGHFVLRTNFIGEFSIFPLVRKSAHPLSGG